MPGGLKTIVVCTFLVCTGAKPMCLKEKKQQINCKIATKLMSVHCVSTLGVNTMDFYLVLQPKIKLL